LIRIHDRTNVNFFRVQISIYLTCYDTWVHSIIFWKIWLLNLSFSSYRFEHQWVDFCCALSSVSGILYYIIKKSSYRLSGPFSFCYLFNHKTYELYWFFTSVHLMYDYLLNGYNTQSDSLFSLHRCLDKNFKIFHVTLYMLGDWVNGGESLASVYPILFMNIQ